MSITQLNKTYKSSYFHEEPENNNHDNQENLIVHEDPINNILVTSKFFLINTGIPRILYHL